jgi:peptide/nickel transport system permease protein
MPRLGLAGWLSILLLGVLLVFALIPEFISPYDPLAQNVRSRLQFPSTEHWFGTDELGRDILSRVIYGARISLLTALIAVIVSIAIGVPLGLIGGYSGGALDEVVSRATDILISIPALILAMAFIAVIGRQPIMVAVVIGIVSAPAFIRVIRATTLKTKNLAFVDAVRSAGAADYYIMFVTILPICASQIYVQALLTASRAVLLEAGLAFLGLGLPPPAPTWGGMLNVGRSYLHQMPWYGIFPGIFLFALVLSLQLMSDSLRKAFKL